MVQLQLLTPTNVDLPVFQLTTDVLWTTNGSPVNGSDDMIVTNHSTSTYSNILTMTGRAYRMCTCNVTTTCSPVCGGFTLNPQVHNFIPHCTSLVPHLSVSPGPHQPQVVQCPYMIFTMWVMEPKYKGKFNHYYLLCPNQSSSCGSVQHLLCHLKMACEKHCASIFVLL
ncbi:hypothetical protein EMCRGX_G004667 [Ephydatia muelleri]